MNSPSFSHRVHQLSTLKSCSGPQPLSYSSVTKWIQPNNHRLRRVETKDCFYITFMIGFQAIPNTCRTINDSFFIEFLISQFTGATVAFHLWTGSSIITKICITKAFLYLSWCWLIPLAAFWVITPFFSFSATLSSDICVWNGEIQ